MEAIVAAFLADPIKAILGSGGVLGLVMLLVKESRTQARSRVRLLGHTYEPNGSYECPTEVRVEIENVGREPTSLEPTVLMTCRYARREFKMATFKIAEADRSLPPVTPHTFVLLGNPPVGFMFSHFRNYRFEFTRGGSVNLRILNASGEAAGPLKFLALKWLFVLTGALPHVKG